MHDISSCESSTRIRGVLVLVVSVMKPARPAYICPRTLHVVPAASTPPQPRLKALSSGSQVPSFSIAVAAVITLFLSQLPGTAFVSEVVSYSGVFDHD